MKRMALNRADPRPRIEQNAQNATRRKVASDTSAIDATIPPDLGNALIEIDHRLSALEDIP